MAWWDVDVDLGGLHPKNLTTRPLQELEHALGHRLHVEARSRYEQMPPGVWNFEAYHYLDAADPALAAYAMLNRLNQVSEWFGMGVVGFNLAATALSGDLDKATICAFYWNPPDQPGMLKYVSSGGVLLMIVDGEGGDVVSCRTPRERLRRLARPVVKVPAASKQLGDYVVEFTVHIVCRNKQDLMTFHWPRFLAANWPSGVEHVEVDARIHAGKPNIIRVRQTLHQMREHEAVARCLAFAQSFRIKLDHATEFRLVGERYPGSKPTDGIVSFVMTRI